MEKGSIMNYKNITVATIFICSVIIGSEVPLRVTKLPGKYWENLPQELKSEIIKYLSYKSPDGLQEGTLVLANHSGIPLALRLITQPGNGTIKGVTWVDTGKKVIMPSADPNQWTPLNPNQRLGESGIGAGKGFQSCTGGRNFCRVDVYYQFHSGAGYGKRAERVTRTSYSSRIGEGYDWKGRFL
jgi:hypothetical protein